MKYCNEIIHQELVKDDHLTCLFCDAVLQQPDTIKHIPCCPKENIINDDGEDVCKNCGVVRGYEVAHEYIDFHESRRRIKTLYDGKYHLENRE